MKPVSKSCSRPRPARFAMQAGCMPAFFLLICSPFLLPAQTPPQTASPEAPKVEPVKTTITVVEKIAAETPANVTVLDTQIVQQTPGANLDDRLRDVPGF